MENTIRFKVKLNYLSLSNIMMKNMRTEIASKQRGQRSMLRESGRRCPALVKFTRSLRNMKPRHKNRELRSLERLKVKFIRKINQSKPWKSRDIINSKWSLQIAKITSAQNLQNVDVMETIRFIKGSGNRAVVLVTFRQYRTIPKLLTYLTVKHACGTSFKECLQF